MAIQDPKVLLKVLKLDIFKRKKHRNAYTTVLWFLNGIKPKIIAPSFFESFIGGDKINL